MSLGTAARTLFGLRETGPRAGGVSLDALGHAFDQRRPGRQTLSQQARFFEAPGPARFDGPGPSVKMPEHAPRPSFSDCFGKYP